MNETIVVVDDEARIRAMVRGVLGDEGFEVLEADGAASALRLVVTRQPQLVILDIWMPHMDGIELLQQLKEQAPRLPIIVISGHGTIETAVRATKLGATDFIEKPFSLDTLLRSVYRALGRETLREDTTAASAAGLATVRAARKYPRLTRARTIRQSVVVQGQGLHSGVRTGIILQPLPPGSGIVFSPVSTGTLIPASVHYVDSTAYATSLRRDGVMVRTIEHLLSALHGYGITNLLVKMEGEIPALDGSAREFCRLLESAGTVEQDETLEEFVIDRSYSAGTPETGKYLRIDPCEHFEVRYILQYPEPVGHQEYHYIHRGPASYAEEIAPARTFGFLKDVEALEQMGLANGGRLHNCILIGDQGVINPPLRFADELARHKVLDLIGDLYLLGRPIRGSVTASCSGHSDNITLVRTLQEKTMNPH